MKNRAAKKAKAAPRRRSAKPSKRGLARQLDISHVYLMKLMRKPWWPKGAKAYDIAACAAAIRANVRVRGGEDGRGGGSESAASDSSPSVAPASDEPAIEFPVEILDELRAAIRDGNEMGIAVAGLKVAGWRMVHSAERGRLGAREVDDLAKATHQVRQAVNDKREADKADGRLIDVDRARAAAGALGVMFVRSLDNQATELVAQVEQWTSSEKFRALGAEDRARQVKAWSEAQTRQVREAAASELEKLEEMA